MNQKINALSKSAVKKSLILIIFGFFNFLIRSTRADWGAPSAPANVPTDFNVAVMNLTNWVLGFVAMIAVLALIWGGVNYLTSAGNEDQAKTGKKAIEYALMGLVIAGIAYAAVVVIVTVIL